MAVGCGANCAKIMVIIFNIIFLCTGVILMAMGIWLLVTLAQSFGPGQIFRLASGADLYRDSAILLISMGAFILFVTIFGLVAAIRESKILLTIYLVLLFIIFGGEIAGGVVAIVYKDRLMLYLEKTLIKSLQFDGNTRYYDDATICRASAIGELWDYAQVMFDCCGVSGYELNGYNNLNSTQLNQCNGTRSKYPGAMVPLTCCYHAKAIHDFDSKNETNLFSQYNCTTYNTNGCVEEVESWIVKFAPILIGIGIGFGLLEMFGYIFVVCLCMNTDKGFKRF